MTVAVLSGKGGTGKTTIAVALAQANAPCTFIDADAEEPNAGLFLKPAITGRSEVSVRVPRVDAALCTHCGDCMRFCRFGAIAVFGDTIRVFDDLCHNCGGCALVCGRKAIHEESVPIGMINSGVCGDISFHEGVLAVVRPSAVPVISALCENTIPGDVIIDCPPGSACSVVEALSRCDRALIVTEPTPFGLHDMRLVIALVRRMSIPFGVVINRCDIGSDDVEHYCTQDNIPVLLRIPNDRGIASSGAVGTPLIDFDGGYADRFRSLFSCIKELYVKG